MLNWIIETNRESFEGINLEKVIQNVINFYEENNIDPKQIIKIYAVDNSGEICQQVSENEMNDIQEKIEQEVKEWKEEVKANYREQEFLRRDYFAALI